MQVTQLINSKCNPAANQFVINTDKGRYFQSYNTLIAKVDKDGITLTGDWDCSQTTLKHLKLFLGTKDAKKVLQKRIDSGEIIVDNNLKIL